MKSNHSTLTAATVATVSFEDVRADHVVVHLVSGDGPVYFTVDGSTPSVAGADTFVIHEGLRVRSVQVPTSSSHAVKLISATADDVAVEVV